MLSAHASASTSNDVIHSANSSLSGNSCELFQESMCLGMEHSIFAVNPSNKTTFGNETWVLDIWGNRSHSSFSYPILLLFNYPMVRR